MTTLYAQNVPNPILFCTQVPQPADFATILSTFANHEGIISAVPRGGDLYIRYPDGVLKNLTQTAGYGSNGVHQGDNAIAVRDPHVHWDGQKALFSMVIGAPEHFDHNFYNWQIYEVTGLGQNDTPVITKVPNQPSEYNNVSPIYGTDDRIIFVSDRPRGGAAHLYPQHDEYESTPIVTGLWRIDPKACTGMNEIEMLTHSPSGDFTPFIDSYGRITFTRWDHLKRDQQADYDVLNPDDPYNNGTFNYSDESATATKSDILPDIEVFPEPRADRTDLFALPEWQNTNEHDLNLFNPWMINEDGKELETINHMGRHEMASGYFTPNFTDDGNLLEFFTQFAPNPNPVRAMFHIVESPNESGVYYATDAPEFGTHASGMIVKMNLSSTESPTNVDFTYVTHPDTNNPSDNPSPEHSGLYRNPIPLSNGEVLVVHTSSTQRDANIGSNNTIASRYDYRLQLLTTAGDYHRADGNYLTGSGISKQVTWYSPDVLLTYNDVLWETFPVEVVARSRPTTTTLSTDDVPNIEGDLFDAADVNVDDFKQFLKRNDLALLVSRNVTSRDDDDKQQPYNLRVEGTSTQTIDPNSTDPSRIYDLKYMQYFQGDQLRGKGGIDSPSSGRRVIATRMHDEAAMTYNLSSMGNEGSVEIADDGSIAALVPANRAMSWQLEDATTKGIVRERVWLSFIPGEVRVCASCHGENDLNQAGLMPPTNPPAALTQLLNHIKTIDSDSDNTIDIHDFYPDDANLQIGQAIDENFETQLLDWMNINEDADAVAWTSATGDACNGDVAVIDNRLTNNTGTIDQLTQTIDLNLFTTATLYFDVAYARYDNTFFDGLKVKVVTCDGEATTTIFEKSGSELATAPDQTSSFVPVDCSEWRSECADLSLFAGQTVDLVFENVGGFGNKLYLDNIKVLNEVPDVSCSSPVLLVELANFSAQAIDDQQVQLDWAAWNEPLGLQYGIERSTDGRHFEKIGTVAAKHLSQVKNSYQIIDKMPFIGDNFYRLKQVETSGEISYSAIEHVFIKEKTALNWQVFPNPNNGTVLHIQVEQEQNLPLQLLDISGRVVWSGQTLEQGVLSVDVADLVNGFYFLEVVYGGERLVRKVVIGR